MVESSRDRSDEEAVDRLLAPLAETPPLSRPTRVPIRPTRPLLAATALVVLIGALLASGEFGSDDAHRASAGPVVHGKPGTVLRTKSPHAVTRPVAKSDLDAAIAANTAFGSKLYRQLVADSGGDSFVFSPLSASEGLAMALGGARGETAEQLASALSLDGLPAAQRAPAMGAVAKHLTSGSASSVSIENALWTQAGFPVYESYVDLLDRAFSAPLRIEDFSGSPEHARSQINEWVQRATGGSVPDLFPAGSISEATRFILADAASFEGRWQFGFRASKDAPFRSLSGGTETAPYMSRHAPLRYYKSKDYQAVDLPYRGGEFSLTAILPAPGHFAEIERDFGPAFLHSVDGGIDNVGVADLTMPRFNATLDRNLIPDLRALGVSDAFSAADLGALSPEAACGRLFISGVQQSAEIRVDEEGTRASAATGVGGEYVSLPAISVNLNRPFLYALRSSNGTVLFLGRYTRP